jgi:hypothetical protein
LRIRVHLIQFRIQHFRLNADPDPDPIRIQDFDDQKWRKKLQLGKKSKIFLSKTTIYISLGLPNNIQVTEEAFSSQKRTSSTSKHEEKKS